jgi:exonuclease SbcD
MGRLLDLNAVVVVLAGPGDDLANLHLNARWVRQQGLYLYSDPSQVLSPLSLRGQRDPFAVNAWCLPYARPDRMTGESSHPAQIGRSLVETVVQRIDSGAINLFLGYAWAQGVGRRPELGPLISPGGQPIEKRFLEYFDYAALGGVHEPVSLGPATLRYCGGLLGTDVDAASDERSVTLVVIEDKSNLFIDEYPLRPRRSFRVLSGSLEELVRHGRESGAGDLLVLRSQEGELTLEQKAMLRSLGPNIVSVETEAVSVLNAGSPAGAEGLSPLLRMVLDFQKEMGGAPLQEETLALLRDLEARL